MVVDRRLVDAHFADLDRNVRLLEQERKRPLVELEADPVRAFGVQHLLQISIETLVNIANHLSAEYGLPAARSYADAFGNLRQHGIITATTCDNLVGMARFRNLVVHRYWEVDMERVYDLLQNRLDDFREAAREINEYLRQQL